MSSRHRIFDCHRITPSENETGGTNNHTEFFSQDQTSDEPITNSNENTHRKPLQIPEASCSEIFTEQIQNPTVEVTTSPGIFSNGATPN